MRSQRDKENTRALLFFRHKPFFLNSSKKRECKKLFRGENNYEEIEISEKIGCEFEFIFLVSIIGEISEKKFLLYKFKKIREKS